MRIKKFLIAVCSDILLEAAQLNSMITVHLVLLSRGNEEIPLDTIVVDFVGKVIY